MRLDTTVVPNGKHATVRGHAFGLLATWSPRPNSYYSWRGSFERVVNIDNGHTLMDIAANDLHVYLQPGQSTTLTCRKLFTDSTSAPCSAPS